MTKHVRWRKMTTASLQEDEHTDYKLSWIEEAMILAADCMHAKMTEEETIKRLWDAGVKDEMLSLILVSAKFLYEDEKKESNGNL